MKAVYEKETKYYKYVYTDWTQPTMTTNNVFINHFKVYNQQAFRPNTGHIGLYADESRIWMNVYMEFDQPFQPSLFYFWVLSGWSDSSGAYNISFHGSNDGTNYTQLATHADVGEGNGCTINLSGVTDAYKFFRLTLSSGGWAYEDGIRISDLVIQGRIRNTIEGTPTDYDYKVEGGKTYIVDVRQSNTNCLTSIPNDIKLELNDGTLTLKAGSKVYVPNGKDGNGNNVFEEVIISADRVFNYGYNDSRLLFTNVAGDYFYGFPVSVCYSGAAAPTGNKWMYWYDTTNNIIKNTSDSGATWVQGYSLPLCKITMNSNNVTSIDQVFNGFGYIGSTLFGLPDVKGLIPNGKNVDGSNNCTEASLSSVQTVTYSTWTRANQPLFLRNNALEITSTGDGRYYAYKDTGTQNSLTYVTYFDTQENKMYHSAATAGSYSQVPWFFFGYVTLTSGVISNMRIQSVQPETIPYYKAFNI